ncbi:MAG TPA: hypothetical protein VHB79_17470 [Polyangiaceae bacterium]|nr:hypothetical protein [Polyangiaceae bacterium]
MGSWSALYFRGELPADFRPEVEGPCLVYRVGQWTELVLPGVADGAASAAALSRRISGQVIEIIVQTTASVVGVAHFENGACQRRIEFADGSWCRVEGEPKPWEDRLFSREELEAAKEVSDPEDDAELEAAFADKVLAAGRSLPWPREWETLFAALDVTRAEWDAAHERPPLSQVQGRATSKLTHAARFSLLAGVGSVIALMLTRDAGFAGLAVVLLLVAWGAAFLRRMNVGRWFF